MSCASAANQPASASACPARAGFTLIELLCAVSILLLLASLVMAMTSSLRQYADRVRCASTIKQAYSGFFQFSVDNRGQVPLTYSGGIKQDNYYFYLTDNRGIGSDTAGGWGILFDGGYVDPHRGWYCVANRNPQWKFNTSINPWPPRRGLKTRSNYGTRPEVDEETATTFPRLASYAGKAILTDVCSESFLIAAHHRTGMNVAYGDGAVRFQRYAAFSAPYRSIPNYLGYSGAYNRAFVRIWTLLDDA